MALTVKEIKRVFVYNGAELDDPSPSMTPLEVAEAYSGAYPELLNAAIQDPVVKGNKMIYTFYKAAGAKG